MTRIVAALFTIGFILTLSSFARADTVAESITGIERSWADTCDDAANPRSCRRTSSIAIDRMRTLLPDVDRHEALSGLFRYTLTLCAEGLKRDPSVAQGLDIKLVLAECAIAGYEKTIKGAGGKRKFIEMYLEATETPKQEADASWQF